MEELWIRGGNRLCGTLPVQGAKNSALPILAAAFLCDGISVFENCPQISDVWNSLRILEGLGCRYTVEGNRVTVDAKQVCACEIPEKQMLKMRSSIVFLGAILGRCGRAIISSPGGCELGPRPIDLHLSALRKLGAEIVEDSGFLHCEAPNGLRGTDIHLTFPSVGATENIMLAACLAKGKTVIYNAAREPEIVDLASFINRAGGKITGCGGNTVCIDGVAQLHDCTYHIMPDRIVAMTYLCAAAATGGKIRLTDANPDDMIPMLDALRQTGCDLEIKPNTVLLSTPDHIRRLPFIQTTVYPGFPTDAGPALIALLSLANGTSVFAENIFDNRYRYIDGLNRMGAKIRTVGKVAVIEGTGSLSGAYGSCTDLRGGAALVVAALAAKGVTVLDKTEHLWRGYEKTVENLSALGAEITLKH